MELIRGIHNIKAAHHGCVLTIGNFDGVHLGHQQVIQHLVQKAKEYALPAVVMVFEPQPRELFTPDQAPARLTRLRDKYHQLQALGVDKLLVVNFTRSFANLPPAQFVKNLLVERLGVKFLVIGDDFCFGAQRQGNFSYLASQAKRYDFELMSTQSFLVSAQRVSSTDIRQALQNNELAEAANMLGHPYTLCGRVAHGHKLGRTIGFPTANLPLKRKVSPVSGVFVVRVKISGQAGEYQGVANIGTRPTFNGLRQQLEVHLFDFSGDLYGKQLEVQLLHKLRDEQKFASLEALQTQINLDAQQSRAWLIERNNVENVHTE